jgi:hypothetical protein
MTATKDIRGPSIDAKRDRTRRTKYRNFQTAKPGQLTTPHIVAGNLYTPVFGPVKNPDLIGRDIVAGLNPKQLLDLAGDACRRDWHCPCCDNYQSKSMTKTRKVARSAPTRWRTEWDDELTDRWFEHMYAAHRDWEAEIDFWDTWENGHGDVPHNGYDCGALVDEAREQWSRREDRAIEGLGWVEAGEESWERWDEDVWSESDGESVAVA